MAGLGFASPALLGAALGAGAAAITALHLLRRRRQRVEVGFAALWARVVGERERRAARLRPLLSWLTHLTILVLLVAAAGDPRPAGPSSRRRWVLILDVSGSMATRDAPGGPSRLERARSEAELLLSRLGEGDRAMVIAGGAQPYARGSLTSNPASLRAQTQVEQEAGAIDLDRSLRLAASALAASTEKRASREGAAGAVRIVLISDGAGLQGALDRIAASPATGRDAGLNGLSALADGGDLRWLPVGGASDNLAITWFAARRQPSHPADYDVLVEVRALRPSIDRPTRARLEVRQEGALVETMALEIPPRAALQRRLADLAGPGARLEARIVPDASEGDAARVDALDLDSVAHAVLPPRRPLRLLYVTPSADLFLEGALLVDESVNVERIAPAAWDARAAADHDLLVLEGFVPPALPAMPALIVNPAAANPPGALDLVATGTVDAPVITAQARRHPLMRFVDLGDVNFARASLLRLAPGDSPLISTVGGALALARERPRRQVALGFDPRQSDLPLRPAFPLLVANTIRWLVGDRADVPPPLRVGEPASVETTASEVTLVAPDGRATRVPAGDGRVQVVPRAPGFHAIEGAGPEALLLAANADPGESEIQSPAALTFAGRPLLPPDPPSPAGARTSWWRWLALLALALLVIEWGAYHRRVSA